MCLKHIGFNSQVRLEIYNMAWRKEKKIEDAARLEPGVVFYVEEGDAKEKIESLKWN
jgi:hypothetical protein